MPAMRYDVAAIGNAIVDVIARCDDAFLARHGAAKGGMRLIDTQTATELYAAMGPGTELSGGSAANTVVGIASFGARAAFIGKVADDQLGQIFAHDIRAAGVAFATRPRAGAEPTARCLILVTPDGERTMNTFLGVSPKLDDADVDPDTIRAAGIVYLEGYLFDQPAAKAAFHRAADLAKAAGRKVALTLSDGFCVDRHRAEFLAFIRGKADILLANEKEIMALYEAKSFEDALRRAQQDVPLAALTRSAKGSLIVAGDRSVTVPAAPVAKVADTTGAGDLYAAGFLFGLASDRDLETCGHLGSLAAAEIISHIGARPEVNLADLARLRGLL